MKHIHHIIPKHMGGSNDPNNLIELTIEEHSRAHYILWNLYGKEEDRIAWLSLSCQIDTDEARRLALISYNKTRVLSEKTKEKMSKSHLGHKVSEETKSKMSKSLSGKKRSKSACESVSKGLTGRKLSEPHKQNISKSLKGKSVNKGKSMNKGSKNGMYGKMWITNGFNSYRINKTNSIPEGYRKGRVIKTPKSL